jgi:hypothetical protein
MEIAKTPHYWWIDKENVVFLYNGILFSHREVWNFIVCRKIDGTVDHHLKWS